MGEFIAKQLLKQYGMEIDEVQDSDVGAGSQIYFISGGEQKYVVKYADENEMNHAEREPEVCEHLLKKGDPRVQIFEKQAGQCNFRR